MVILQVHFDYTGGYGKEMYKESLDLAKSINDEPGFLWKIWTENEEKGIAGGVYAFDTRENAEVYIKMHKERIEKFGIGKDFVVEIFDVNDDLSQVTNFKFQK
ncbi:MAG: monooxygenase [Campylobacteraceae bacterium]|nr:monooxygenase [Campylobacteraceae bacterium]